MNQVIRPHQKAVLVHIDFTSQKDIESLEEFQELAVSAGFIVSNIVMGKRHQIEPKYFVGEGKVLEIQTIVTESNADFVLFNHYLSPAQERNLEKKLLCPVLDRIELILHIFAQRAKTFEGKLQVELAQLQHQSTRLIRGWTHLERQRGGIGVRGGPGETQLELDRRAIRQRIKTIQKYLQKVRAQRTQVRYQRLRHTVPTITLAGYTNAGKSTLFNQLTTENVYVADRLFATLDPTVRRIDLPHFGMAMLTDTVGFIRHLPHDLVEAFQATLEETKNADLILHIVDAHQETRYDNIEAVNEVLNQIQASEIPQLLVFNKIDLLQRKPKIERDENGRPTQVWVSGLTGEGVDLLYQAVVESLSQNQVHCCVRLLPQEADIRSQLYDIKAVVKEEFAENGDSLLEVILPLHFFEKVNRHFIEYIKNEK